MAPLLNPGVATNRSGKSGLLVCFAVREESCCFLKQGGRGLARILITGMGRSNTIRALQTALDREPPEVVLTCGFAGGLKPELRRGTVLFETENRVLGDNLKASGAMPARFVCVDRVAVTAAEKLAWRQLSGADAVEMESTAIQEECRKRGIPCATARVILDEAEEDLPLDFNALMTSEARISPCKLMWALVKDPAKIRLLMRFRKQTVAASACLGELLARVCAQNLNVAR